MQQQRLLFEDKDVKITDKIVQIKCYYFPLGTSKIIPLKDILKVEVRPLGIARMRLWGMDAMAWGYWLPGDCSRCARDQFIAIYTGKCIVPSLTTENTMVVYNILMTQLNKLQQEKINQSQPITGIYTQNLSMDQNSMERPIMN